MTQTSMQTRGNASVANLYNPHEQSATQLIERFVVRRDVFQELFQALKSTQMTTPQRHYLIEGQRGMGKTTLLLRLSYAIEQDADLRHWLIPIVLKEEVYYGIRHLFKLWEVIAGELEIKNTAFAGLTGQMAEVHSSTPMLAFAAMNYEHRCFDLLLQALREHAQKILLCIDNLGEMLQNFTDQENLRFREMLTTCLDVRLIGTTAVVFDVIPQKNLLFIFRNFFDIIRLDGLNKAETRQLLLELAKTTHAESIIQNLLEQHPGRLEALRILTGGVIRTMVLLFEIFTSSQNGNAATDFENILDRVTPLYQNRMKDLTPLQREVVHAIALHWEAVSAEEIARETYLPADGIRVVLSELEKRWLLECSIAENGQHFYHIKERFFNIWYLMRLAPNGGRSKILWLLHFLESWYDQQELNQQARKHTAALAARHAASDSAYYLTEALAKTGQLDMATEHQMIRETQNLLRELKISPSIALSLSDQEIFNKAEKSAQQADYAQVTHLLFQIKHKNAQIYFRLGDAFRKLGAYPEAQQYFLKAVEKEHVEAMLHLAGLYRETFQDYQQAETYYVRAAAKGNLHALLALGNLYAHELQDYPNAEKYYTLTVQEAQKRAKLLTSPKFSLNAVRTYLLTFISGEVDHSDQDQVKDVNGVKGHYLQTLKSISAEALLQLGNLSARELKNYEKAQTYYVAAMKAGSQEASGQLGLLYHYTLNDDRNALKYYTLALKQGETKYAAINLGILYQNIKDYANAEKYYLLAVAKGQTGAINGLAWMYFEQKSDKQKALHYARQAAAQEENMYTAHTLACIYLWNDQPEQALQIARKFMYAEEAYAALKQDILLYLMLLLAKKQHHALTAYFAAPELNLRERFPPFYYAFLYCLHDPNYHKHPPELVDPIGSMIGQVQRLAVSYA